jgi:hypothetical protein
VKRLFWLGVGLAAGAYLTRRATEAAQNLTPSGIGANLADGLRELGAGLGAFGAEVRAGMQAREQELTALLERRTGAGVPTLGEALSDPTATPAHAWAPQTPTPQTPTPQTPTPHTRASRTRAPGAGA